jgi:glutathione synthase/RimK-type ligase-like ATP-grasp enzyme
MRFSFIVEDDYRDDVMPLAVAACLVARGHQVDTLTPQHSVTPLRELASRSRACDAVVLKTLSNGPGLVLLEAAAAAGVPTINDARAIRPVRDKAVAAAVALRRGIPFPTTYFAASSELLPLVPPDDFPLVVKPNYGWGGRSIHVAHDPDDLRELVPQLQNEGFVLAQPYVANPGFDIKVYSIGRAVYATVQRSPLHPEVDVPERAVSVDPELEQLVHSIGDVFGLDLFGVDVLETPTGWVVVDVNDFPSFSLIPDAADLVADVMERIAQLRSDGDPVRSASAHPPNGSVKAALTIGPSSPIARAEPAL